VADGFDPARRYQLKSA